MDYLGAIGAIEEALGGCLYLSYPQFKIRVCYQITFSFAGSNGSSKEAISPLAGKLFVVIGAGGAGKALAYGGKEKGARVVVADRIYGMSSISDIATVIF